jgi:hypothetical protein
MDKFKSKRPLIWEHRKYVQNINTIINHVKIKRKTLSCPMTIFVSLFVRLPSATRVIREMAGPIWSLSSSYPSPYLTLSLAALPTLVVRLSCWAALPLMWPALPLELAALPLASGGSAVRDLLRWLVQNIFPRNGTAVNLQRYWRWRCFNGHNLLSGINRTFLLPWKIARFFQEHHLKLSH